MFMLSSTTGTVNPNATIITANNIWFISYHVLITVAVLIAAAAAIGITVFFQRF
jgi:hypothetical protein